jgi:hypothetical protein
MLFEEMTFNIRVMLSFEENAPRRLQASGNLRLGREKITASHLLDEIAHSLRHHREADFSYRYIICGLKAINCYITPTSLENLATPRQRRKTGDLEDEILSILRALGGLKEELGSGQKHRQREDAIFRRRIDVRIHELVKRVEELNHAAEGLGDMLWVDRYVMPAGDVNSWGFVRPDGWVDKPV